MKKLSREEMKNLVGGKAKVETYHCYGTQANCTNPQPGGCKVGEANCHDYCSNNGGPTYWC
jgi:hypothetical protein